LSAQFTVAATGRPSDMRNLFPAEPPLPASHHEEEHYQNARLQSNGESIDDEIGRTSKGALVKMGKVPRLDMAAAGVEPDR
jgi:hypothetical protein